MILPLSFIKKYMIISDLSSSQEDYLEAIYDLQTDNHVARVKDIAKRLNVSSASVTGAVKNLGEMKLVNYAPYGHITLTEEGLAMAKDVTRRHQALREFLIQILSLDPDKADEAACKMEHVISPEVTDRIIAFSAFLRTCPVASQSWLQAFQRYYSEGENFTPCEDCTSPCVTEYAQGKN